MFVVSAGLNDMLQFTLELNQRRPPDRSFLAWKKSVKRCSIAAASWPSI
jgi:hypothetical protein